MTNEKIKNATLNTADDIRTLTADLNLESTFENVPVELTEKVNAYNKAVVLAKAKTFIVDNAKDFYKSIICVATDNPFNAITATVASLSLTESGNIEVKELEKALTFDDFYNAKIALLAFAHADGKPTADDRKKAHAYFYGVNGDGLLQCLIYTASNAQKLDGVTLTKSADLAKAYATIRAEYTAQKKDNPFDGDSGRKRVEQLSRVIAEFIGAFDKWQVTKYHFDAFAQIVATTNRKGVFTINSVPYAMQALILIARHAFNKVPFEVKDKAKILKADK